MIDAYVSISMVASDIQLYSEREIYIYISPRLLPNILFEHTLHSRY